MIEWGRIFTQTHSLSVRLKTGGIYYSERVDIHTAISAGAQLLEWGRNWEEYENFPNFRFNLIVYQCCT